MSRTLSGPATPPTLSPSTAEYCTATVIDLHSRKVVDYSAPEHLRTSLVIEALTAAFVTRIPPEGVIFHSDIHLEIGLVTASQGTDVVLHESLLARGSGSQFDISVWGEAGSGQCAHRGRVVIDSPSIQFMQL